MTGHVRTLIADKGFGFIAVDGRRSQFFFHLGTDVVDQDFELKRGDRVVFDEVLPAPAKGPRATNVALVVGR